MSLLFHCFKTLKDDLIFEQFIMNKKFHRQLLLTSRLCYIALCGMLGLLHEIDFLFYKSQTDLFLRKDRITINLVG